MKRKIALLLSMLALTGLSACGGTPNQVTGTAPSIGGIWKGEVETPSGDTVAGIMLVTEDGRFFSAAENVSNDCSNVAIGKLTLAGSTFTGTGDFGIITYTSDIGVQLDCSFSDGSVGGTASLSGTVASRTTLTLTSENITTTGTLLPIITGTMDFDTLYNEKSSLSTVAGDWSLSTGAVVTINADGAIYSKDVSNGCVVNGKVSIVNPSYNAYALSITYTDCGTTASALNGLTATGLVTKDDTVTPNVLYMGYSLTLSDGSILVIASHATN